MARVLLGWELGQGPVYTRTLRGLAETLVANGHQVAVALQRVDLWTPLAGVAIFQAPLWPGLIVNSPQQAGHTSTMADILARLALGRAGTLGGMIAAWDTIVAQVRPDLAVAKFAPALLNAVRGRVPSVTIGTGFAQPPGDVPQLRRFAGEPGFDEEALLDTVDAELRVCGRDPLPALPALFASDHALVASFAELDPYAVDRTAAHCLPAFNHVVRRATDGREVFCYGHAGTMAASPLWQALQDQRLPVRVHLADAPEPLIAHLSMRGFTVERRAVPWAKIAARSRVIVSHGGHGTASAALTAGLPHFAMPYDLEKTLIGDALTGLGAGRVVSPHLGAQEVGEAIRASYNDAAMLEQATLLAPGFAARNGGTVQDALLALIGG